MTYKKNLFKSSGRNLRWNLIVFISFAVSATALFLKVKGLTFGYEWYLTALPFLIISTAFVFINCPKCSKSWFYYATLESKGNNWKKLLNEMEECPGCVKKALDERDKRGWGTKKRKYNDRASEEKEGEDLDFEIDIDFEDLDLEETDSNDTERRKTRSSTTDLNKNELNKSDLNKKDSNNKDSIELDWLNELVDSQSYGAEEPSRSVRESSMSVAMGSVIAIGFDSNMEYLLVVSRSGRYVYTLDTLDRVTRDYSMALPVKGCIEGVGPLSGQSIQVTEVSSTARELQLRSADEKYLVHYQPGTLTLIQC
ncbi:hypothetical protein [Pleionea litopenaei]|uniref:Uncharacterized protein n=1 Tax=Pleionea litopenaei TaxID=3070815 RepID=A0AA51RTL5_9GAMM|nr:hypothetical protein [Pleionea sp. HL-JVS1]WMS87387.1 hypothetical protein Q9312_00305 [Pleionea sp. HL-JVS1]